MGEDGGNDQRHNSGPGGSVGSGVLVGESVGLLLGELFVGLLLGELFDCVFVGELPDVGLGLIGWLLFVELPGVGLVKGGGEGTAVGKHEGCGDGAGVGFAVGNGIVGDHVGWPRPGDGRAEG